MIEERKPFQLLLINFDKMPTNLHKILKNKRKTIEAKNFIKVYAKIYK